MIQNNNNNSSFQSYQMLSTQKNIQKQHYSTQNTSHLNKTVVNAKNHDLMQTQENRDLSEENVRATSLSFYRRFKRVNEKMRDRSQQNDSLDMSNDKENIQQRLNQTTYQNIDMNVDDGKYIQNNKQGGGVQYMQNGNQNDSLGNIDTKSDMHTNCSYIPHNREPLTPQNHVQNILFNTQKSQQNSTSQIASNQYLNQILKNQENQRNQQKENQELVLLDVTNNQNIHIDNQQQYKRQHQQHGQQIHSNTLTHRTAQPVISGGNGNGDTYLTSHNNSQFHFASNQLELQSAWSQQPQQQKQLLHQEIKDREKYNIFTDDCEMRRLAILSSSNKKRRHSSQKKSQQKMKYVTTNTGKISNNDFSPNSNTSGLFINGLGEQLTESQCRDFEKKAKIQKTNFTSLKQQQLEQQKQQQLENRKRKTSGNNSNSKNKNRTNSYQIKIDNLTTISPHSNVKSKNNQTSDSDDEEELDIIQAASTHHNRSISGTRSTQSRIVLDQTASGGSKPQIHPQQFIFLGTESTLTPSNGLNISHINQINTSKNQNQKNLVQDSFLQDSNHRLNYQSKTNPVGTHSPSPLSYQINKGLQILNQNTFTDDNSLTMDHQSPSISQTIYRNNPLDQSSLVLTQHQANTIRKKMEQIAKELADTEELGLDENTLIRMFELKTEKIMNISTINNQFTFEDNIANQNSQSRRQLQYSLNQQSNSQNNKTMVIEDQSSLTNSQNNLKTQSRQQNMYRTNQQVDTFLTDPNLNTQDNRSYSNFGTVNQQNNNMFAQYNNNNNNNRKGGVGGSNSNNSLTPRSRKSNSAKFNDHFHYTDEICNQQQPNLVHHHQKGNNLSKEFRETFAIKDLQSLTQPHFLGQSEEGGLQVSQIDGINCNFNDLNHSQFTIKDTRLSQSHLKNNQTYSGYKGGGDSTVVITNNYGNEESRFFGNQMQDESMANHLIKSGSIGKSKRSQKRSLKNSANQKYGLNSQYQSRKMSAEKRTSTISRSSSKKRYSSVKSKFMDHFKTHQTIPQERVSLTIDHRLDNSNNRHNHSSVLVDPFVNDQLISLNDQFLNNNQTQIYIPNSNCNNNQQHQGQDHFGQGSQVSQEYEFISDIPTQDQQQDANVQQQIVAQSNTNNHGMSRQYYNSSQEANNQRQQSITPAFAESINLNIKTGNLSQIQQQQKQQNQQQYQEQNRQRSTSKDRTQKQRIVKQKSKSVLINQQSKKALTQKQSLLQSMNPFSKENINVTPQHQQLQMQMNKTNSQQQFRDTLQTQQSRQTYHQGSQQRQSLHQQSNSKGKQRSKSIQSQGTRSVSQASRHNHNNNSTYKQFIINAKNYSTQSQTTTNLNINQLKSSTASQSYNVQSAPRCKCLQKLQISKETIKQALKVKYDARLKEMKNQFEQKFKKNEITWKNRLECHKQALQKEQLKNQELQALIEEMASRVSQVEKKNKEMFSMVRQQQKLQQINQAESNSQIDVNQDLQQLESNNQNEQKSMKRKGSKLAQRAYQQKLQSQQNSQGFLIQDANISEGQNTISQRVLKRKNSDCESSSSEEENDDNQYDSKNIVNDDNKLKRIEKILYKKKQ